MQVLLKVSQIFGIREGRNICRAPPKWNPPSLKQNTATQMTSFALISLSTVIFARSPPKLYRFIVHVLKYYQCSRSVLFQFPRKRQKIKLHSLVNVFLFMRPHDFQVTILHEFFSFFLDFFKKNENNVLEEKTYLYSFYFL